MSAETEQDRKLAERLATMDEGASDHNFERLKDWYAERIAEATGPLREALRKANELLQRADDADIGMKFSNAVSLWKAEAEKLLETL